MILLLSIGKASFYAQSIHSQLKSMAVRRCNDSNIRSPILLAFHRRTWFATLLVSRFLEHPQMLSSSLRSRGGKINTIAPVADLFLNSAAC